MKSPPVVVSSNAVVLPQRLVVVVVIVALDNDDDDDDHCVVGDKERPEPITSVKDRIFAIIIMICAQVSIPKHLLIYQKENPGATEWCILLLHGQEMVSKKRGKR